MQIIPSNKPIKCGGRGAAQRHPNRFAEHSAVAQSFIEEYDPLRGHQYFNDPLPRSRYDSASMHRRRAVCILPGAIANRLCAVDRGESLAFAETAQPGGGATENVRGESQKAIKLNSLFSRYIFLRSARISSTSVFRCLTYLADAAMEIVFVLALRLAPRSFGTSLRPASAGCVSVCGNGIGTGTT